MRFLGVFLLACGGVADTAPPDGGTVDAGKADAVRFFETAPPDMKQSALDFASADLLTSSAPADLAPVPDLFCPILPSCGTGYGSCCNGAQQCIDSYCWNNAGQYCNDSGIGVQVLCWHTNLHGSTCGPNHMCWQPY